MSTLSLGIITFYRTSVKNVLHIDSSAPSPVYLLTWSYSQSSMFMIKKIRTSIKALKIIIIILIILVIIIVLIIAKVVINKYKMS